MMFHEKGLRFSMFTLSLLVVMLAGSGCAERKGTEATVPDERESVVLSPQAAVAHRAVMLQHLESVQQIVAALGREDFETARQLTESHLGFFMHREAMQRQQPENFPPAYHDLAMAHHQAAEELADVMPSHDLKRILPKLDGVLKACMACHLAYRVKETGR